ncbi:maleylacetoacetate isomerase [Sandaracinobacteroides saxicola]|uniref:Maleylacetoacetate isomerase n=1 Tax=Sandaracinobacteroides saxicola TaxID=2759707 RepID=A0A7G5ILI6_9SPHN|nr:maleylacetoacetate isomerase [Sandaracinobacteroides saxicola]QMW24228.1 maleylacetoacetate isomerase [Sandaracinobacteroides saxicola]
MRLFGYWRSTATWRVRIALGLKRVAVEQVALDLRLGEQRARDYLARNPQGLVPALELEDGTLLTQSLAIIDYLEERFPEPALLPGDAVARARVRAFAQVIACDVHPIQNLKILNRVRDLGGDPQAWARTVIADGLSACETLLQGQNGPFAFGDAPSLADVLLVPQLANARRFGVPLDWPRINAVEAACNALPAFQAARPEMQADADA